MLDSNHETLIEFIPSNHWKDEHQCAYPKKMIHIEDGDVICFIGCNGIGKTTVLEQIMQKLEHTYGYLSDVGRENIFANLFHDVKNDPAGLVVNFHNGFNSTDRGEEASIIAHLLAGCESTGEELMTKVGKAAGLIGKYAKDAEEMHVPLVMLFDDCDVGTSIDVQDEIVNLFNLMHDNMTEHGIKHAIIITANSYELCKSFKCIDITTLEPVAFNSYEEYKKFVLKTRKNKDKRDARNRARIKKKDEDAD